MTARTLPLIIVFMLSAAGLPALASASGSSPADAIPFDVASGAIALTLGHDEEVWVRTSFVPTPTVTHLALETEGGRGTDLAVFATVTEALADRPIVQDGSSSSDVSVRVALGFLSPFLVRVTATTAGALTLRGRLVGADSRRCDWPAGCPLVVAAQGEPAAAEVLRTLRRVRDEVLSRTRVGGELTDLYWRLGVDLVPALLTDEGLRQRLYLLVSELLPLADEAVAEARGEGRQTTFSRADHDRLLTLLDLLVPHLSPRLAAELRGRWREVGLSGRVGLPLATTLAETGLLGASRSHRVIFKLRTEPPPVESGSPGLRTGDLGLDVRIAAAGARRVRGVHTESPARRAAGLMRTIVLEVPNLGAARALAAELEDHPAVEWAEVGSTIRALGTDPFRGDLWGLDAIRAPAAWTASRGSCATRVAVVDTGLRAGLADLDGRVLDQLGYDFIDEDPEPEDGHGHGTHVAGTIASALDNSVSIAGVAPTVCVFGVRVLDDEGSGSSEAVAAGIVHAADAGARVINLSLGCDCDTQRVIEEALAYAAGRDVVIAAAAGNDGADELHYPASSRWTLAVGAVDRNLELADFSSFGPGLDLVAPGVDVVSLFRDGESCSGSGTSMATPHVAGVAALVRSLDPGLDREEVGRLLREQARDLGAPGYDTRFGAGLVDAADAVGAAGGGPGGEPCIPSATVMCLRGDRFRVEARWRRPDGTTGSGQVVRLTQDTGYFWFFNSANVEMVVKVLDACSGFDRFWVFAGGLTNVEVRLRVTDSVTGRFREYLNPLDRAFQPVQDTDAFDTCGAAGASVWNPRLPPAGAVLDAGLLPSPSVFSSGPSPMASQSAGSGTCTDTATAICLNDGRFRVETSWRRPDGSTGSGQAVRLTPDTAYFWFFNSSNVEMVVKLLDACGGFGRYWVFAGGLTNVEVRTHVTDTATNRFREYLNPLDRAFQPVQDTDAFDTCP